ncbi:EamA family transporter [Microbacterium excoecariae]|uniref:EamA family transporter n=1 Tax=Microbacterium excoecariae TaxID=2715210 RepID=UPI00140B1A3F|nr:EamA family transporter [Microbacterium excoecariae]NHI17176.1 EamA family transporter [Microbacterium excoecariae]
MPAPSPRIGILAVMGSCLSLQVGAAMAMQLFPALGPWGVTAVRLTVAAVILCAVARPAIVAWDRQQWRAVAIYGVTLGGMNAFFYAAIERLPLGPAVAIEFLGPLALAAALSRRARDLALVGVALAGMGLLALDGILGADPLDPIGVALVLIAAALWAGYIRSGAQVAARVPGMGGLAAGLAIASIVLIPFGAPAMARLALEPSLIPLALATAVFASVLPYSLELVALRRLPERVFGVLLSLEPVFAAIVGWALLAQGMTWLRAAAITLVVVASAAVTLGVRGGAPDRAAPRRRLRV